MIFISYNHADISLVDMIARRLEIEFGLKNISYDQWSINPGDSIIENMGAGIENYSVFFLMLSPNSLKSEMVKREWQSALMRKTNCIGLKFILIRIDDYKPPAVLADLLYIDLYGEGLDNTIEKMKNVIKNESTYLPSEDISNLKYTSERITGTKVKITVKVSMYVENNLTIIIGVPHISSSDFTLDDLSDLMTYGSSGTINTSNKIIEVKGIILTTPLDKNTPFYVTVSTTNDVPISDIVGGQMVSQNFIEIRNQDYI